MIPFIDFVVIFFSHFDFIWWFERNNDCNYVTCFIYNYSQMQYIQLREDHSIFKPAWCTSCLGKFLQFCLKLTSYSNWFPVAAMPFGIMAVSNAGHRWCLLSLPQKSFRTSVVTDDLRRLNGHLRYLYWIEAMIGEIYPVHYVQIDGLVHDCSISSALAMETLQSCTKPKTLCCAFWLVMLCNFVVLLSFLADPYGTVTYSCTGWFMTAVR